jgi:hypothetical protein
VIAQGNSAPTPPPTAPPPNYGMMRVTQRVFVPAPPDGTEQLELRFRAPSRSEGEVQFVTTVDLR